MRKGAEGLDADEDGRIRVIENDAELVRSEETGKGCFLIPRAVGHVSAASSGL